VTYGPLTNILPSLFSPTHGTGVQVEACYIDASNPRQFDGQVLSCRSSQHAGRLSSQPFHELLRPLPNRTRRYCYDAVITLVYCAPAIFMSTISDEINVLLVMNFVCTFRPFLGRDAHPPRPAPKNACAGTPVHTPTNTLTFLRSLGPADHPLIWEITLMQFILRLAAAANENSAPGWRDGSGQKSTGRCNQGPACEAAHRQCHARGCWTCCVLHMCLCAQSRHAHARLNNFAALVLRLFCTAAFHSQLASLAPILVGNCP
jgi:hypothetical protein